ncbi:MAG TPA: hemolysin family protein [Desulforhopalus sp.]|nr:hemolysin family protein [Desulforhopalus sp.]
MLQTLILSVSLAVIVSALCSICEAALYSITNSQLEMLKKTGSKAAIVLQNLRSDIEEPITAILTLNTIANTIGASVAGMAAAKLFGEENILLFSASFTLTILLFSEIIPKTLGVNYAFRLAPIIGFPLQIVVIGLKPIIWLCRTVTRLLPKKTEDFITGEEIQTIASLSRESGSLEETEEMVINNIIELKNKIARQVMTPRTVTFTMNERTNVGKAMSRLTELSSHSRIPIYNGEPDNITGIILRKDVLQAAAEGKTTISLARFKHPVHFIPETAPLNRILIDFFDRRQHLFVVVDEYGTMTGVISLEDVLEEIVGREIIDESDKAKDMRELARSRNIETRKNEKKSQQKKALLIQSGKADGKL